MGYGNSLGIIFGADIFKGSVPECSGSLFKGAAMFVLKALHVNFLTVKFTMKAGCKFPDKDQFRLSLFGAKPMVDIYGDKVEIKVACFQDMQQGSGVGTA
jgi:hypothetical protein